MVCWHWDHSKSVNVKDINILTAFYHSQKDSQALRVPVAVESIKKAIRFYDVNRTADADKKRKTGQRYY